MSTSRIAKTSQKVASLVGLGTLALTSHAWAQAGDPTNDPFGLGYGAGGKLTSQTDLPAFILSIINTALTFLAIIALIIMLVAGFQWMTAGADDKKVDGAKTRMKNGLIGLVIIFLSWALVNFVFGILAAPAKT